MTDGKAIPAMFDLSGKVAIVTGSTLGIGKSIAEQMAAHGAKVVISSRKADRCEAVAAEVNRDWARGPAEAHPIACNVGYQEQCRQLVDGTMAKFGQVDILVCNAAVNPYFGSVADMPDEAFNKTMTVNILSPIWLANMVVPGMKERRDGVIIVISSIGGVRGSKEIGAYCLSKAADMQLVRNFTAEFGPYNIRSNCLAPGLIRTNFARALWEDPEREARVITGYPLGRLGEPEDIAGMAVALAGPAGRWFSGQTILVDGGANACIGRSR